MLDAGAAKHRRHTLLAISQCGASPSARHGVCDRMAGHIWRWPIPGEDMHVVQPRERRDRCREDCCGPPDRPRGILGCPFLMAAAVVGGRRPGGHHRSDGQPIKMERQPQRPARSEPTLRVAHEENANTTVRDTLRMYGVFATRSFTRNHPPLHTLDGSLCNADPATE